MQASDFCPTAQPILGAELRESISVQLNSKAEAVMAGWTVFGGF